MFEVVLTQRAVDEIEQAQAWWANNRSIEQANRWYNEFINVLLRLGKDPQRFPFAPENNKFNLSIRQLNFGLANKPTHRAIYVIKADQVVVLRIRHLSQENLADLI
jgi:plasmid stabilization system protein ParE